MKPWKTWPLLALLALLAGLISTGPVSGKDVLSSAPGLSGPAALASSRAPGSFMLQSEEPFGPQVRGAEKQDTSPPLQDEAQFLQAGQAPPSRPRLSFPKVERAPEGSPAAPEADLQEASPVQPAEANLPAPRFNFDGLPNRNLVVPPDPMGDIGPGHYVQWVNLSLAIWRIDRAAGTATLAWGPAGGNTLWAGFGGPCEFTNHGDPIVLYDHLADRWFISQFSINGPYYQCIAVSQSGDPTGGWYRYSYLISSNKMNDYPKFGVWPDGYYMSMNQFVNGVWAGAGVAVFEREKMLAGLPARMVIFDLNSVNKDFGGMLPSDLDGPPPPPGAPNPFVEVDDGDWIPPVDALRLWEFRVNWANPAAATYGQAGQPDAVLPVRNFTPLCSKVPNCIPQPGGAPLLDAIADRMMYRLQYRNFGAYATLVSNHTVDAGGGRAGLRWYELRDNGGGWDLYQQGTYSGGLGDSDNRWMGSAALDKAGDLAIGFSISSPNRNPSIHYAGRLLGDPSGILAQGERVLFAGSGVQTTPSGRWGDYSMLVVDPVDDCTFWYTSEYYAASSSTGWRTRIGSFAFPDCLAQETGKLAGTVRNTAGEPLPGASVEAGGRETLADANGFYQFFNLPAGAYTVNVSLYGYKSTSENIQVNTNQTTLQDFTLETRPKITVSGTVRDGSGQGWPLYARLQIDAPGASFTVFTDPFSGVYQVQLAEDVTHSFTVEAVIPGYQVGSGEITPTAATMTQDFNLAVEEGACKAPGYDPAAACSALAGSLLAGFVSDANTGAGLAGAVVSGESAGMSTTSLATPEDPLAGDGFYALFLRKTGTQKVIAAMEKYGSLAYPVDPGAGKALRQDFPLPAGRLVVSPARLDMALTTLIPHVYALTLSNTGTLTATYTLSEVNSPAPASSGTFAEPARHLSPKRIHDRTAAAVYDYQPPEVPELPFGKEVGRWPSGLAAAWGIGVDLRSNEVWAGRLGGEGASAADLRFLPGGEFTGDIVDLSTLPAVFPADLAFDPASGAFWQVLVGEGNCLVEFDPLAKALTGRQICPPFDTSQRGLAFNPVDETFYSGSWNNGILYHFDQSGRLLDSAYTGLNLAGLAFHPASGLLFALSNASAGFDVYVLDTRQGYRLLGGFDLPGMEAFQQAGLELDCAGRLWTINQATGEIIAADSGAGPACTWDEIPWAAVEPGSGSLPPGGEQTIRVTVGPQGWVPGLQEGFLTISADTPYGDLTVPLRANSVYEMSFPLVFK